jgi:thiocyanate hydrolase subunit beta
MVPVSREYDVFQRQVSKTHPAYREPLDSPYHLSNALYHVLTHVTHDVGGQPDAQVPYEPIEETE